MQGESKEGEGSEAKAQNGYVLRTTKHAAKSCSTAIGLAIVPVKVRAFESGKVVQTYAFLDGGSNTSFCSENLMKQLDVTGRKTTLLSLTTTMEKVNSKTGSSIVSLEHSDLKGESQVRVETE